MLGLFGMPSGSEWLVILVFGLLLFGRRLPDVARSMGRSIVEFKKGLREVSDDVDDAAKSSERMNNARPPRLENQSGASERKKQESTAVTSGE